jgi:uncharacterized membrane protein required for colicin V production
MDLENLKFSWVDLATVGMIVVGVFRGRKRGMSEEILDTFKWLLIVVAAGYLYRPLGDQLSAASIFSTLFCYITVYLVILLFFRLLFSFIRRRLGEKLVGSDMFGAGEYYMGMLAGGFRYLCIVVVALALLNARYYSPDELQKLAKWEEYNWGTKGLIPHFSAVQAEVFQNSLTGNLARNYLTSFLIVPTPPSEKPNPMRNLVRAREQQLNEVLDKK